MRVTGACGLGKSLTIPTGTELHNAVLLDGVTITSPGLFAQAIIENVPHIGSDNGPSERVFQTLGVRPETCGIQPLREQGSTRCYARLATGNGSWVWSRYASDRRENALFVATTHLLASLGINVPTIAYHDALAGELVCEDLGDTDLLAAPTDLRERYLLEAISQIARLHVHGGAVVRQSAIPLQPPFTKGYYEWERDYFRQSFLQDVLGRIDLWEPVRAEYRAIRDMLLAEEPVPIHRDFQSANILIHHDQAYLIDYQGMRLGCAVYDIASLLFDPYIDYAPELRERVWRHYQHEVTALGKTPPTDDLLAAAAIQRLLQALGAYGRLGYHDGKEWFKGQIAPALERLCMVAGSSGGYLRLEEMGEKCILYLQYYK